MSLRLHSSFRVLSTSFNDLFRRPLLPPRGQFQARDVSELLGIPRTQQVALEQGRWGRASSRAKGALQGLWERPLARSTARRTQTELPWNPGPGKLSCFPEILGVPRGAQIVWDLSWVSWASGLPPPPRLETQELNAKTGGGHPEPFAGRRRALPPALAWRSRFSDQARV